MSDASHTLQVPLKLAVTGLLVVIVGVFAGWTPASSLAQGEASGYGSDPGMGSAVVINTVAGVPGLATVTLSATGDADLTISGYTLATSAEITVSGAEAPFTLTAGDGAPQTLTVTCSSVEPGVFSDQLTVEFDAADSPTIYMVACNVLPVNIAQNGDFSADAAGWSVWGETVLGAETGVLEMTSTGAGGIYQDAPYVIPAGAVFEMALDLGNSSASDQMVEIMLHAPDEAEALACQFTVPAGASLATYTLRGATMIPWTDLRLEVVPQTYDGLPALLVDNITVQYQPTLVVDGIECMAALVADTNLVQNSDFAMGFAGWGVWDDQGPSVEAGVLEFAGAGGIFQDVGMMVPVATPLEMTLDLGNTSITSQVVNVSLVAPGAADELVCEFSVPGEAALQTYTLRGLTAVRWDNLHVEIGRVTDDDQLALQIDNVNVQYKPALVVTAVECVPPRIAANTNVIRNGDFAADSADWGTEGAVSVTINAEVFELTATGPGSIFQDMGVSVPASVPLELTLSLGNSGAAPKDVEVVLNAPGWPDALVCAFTLAAETPLQTYTLRGLTPASASDLRVAIRPLTPADQSTLQIDNVDVQYKPMLRIFGVECVPPASADG